MKNLSFILLVCLCCSFTPVQKNADIPAEAEATIYIYRVGQYLGAGANWSMFVDENKICKLSNNKFIKVSVKKGKHIISSKQGGVSVFKKEMEVEIDAEPGKSYYIACHVKSSITRARLEMLEVTKSTADKQMSNLTLDNCQEAIDN